MKNFPYAPFAKARAVKTTEAASSVASMDVADYQ